MSTVPISLPYGYIGVYGLGNSIGATGLRTGDTLNRFATIYFIGVGMNSALVGNSIVYNSENEVCRLVWDNFYYPVVPANKIIGTEVFF